MIDYGRPRRRAGLRGFADPYSIEQRVLQLNADVDVLERAVNEDVKAILARKAAGTMTEADAKRGKWLPAWNQFLYDWNAWKAGSVYSSDSDGLSGFENRFRQLRLAYETLPGAVQPAVPVSTLPGAPSMPWGFLGLVALGLGVAYVAGPVIASAVASRRVGYR